MIQVLVNRKNCSGKIGLKMGYNINWQVEKRVIYLKLFDSLSADELIECNQQAMRMVHEGIQPIHIIIDTLAIVSYPTNLRWVIHMIQGNAAKAVGWRVVVTDDNNIRVLLSTILSVLHVEIHACCTMQHANEFIAQFDAAQAARVY